MWCDPLVLMEQEKMKMTGKKWTWSMEQALRRLISAPPRKTMSGPTLQFTLAAGSSLKDQVLFNLKFLFRTFKRISKLFHTPKRPIGLDILKPLNTHDRFWAVYPCCFETHSVCWTDIMEF